VCACVREIGTFISLPRERENIKFIVILLAFILQTFFVFYSGSYIVSRVHILIFVFLG